MNPQELQDAARRQPFQPFRLALTTGATYDIRHPDLIMVGRRSAVIGLVENPEGTAHDRTMNMDLLHIVAIEQLAVPPSSSNGPPAG